MIEGLGAASTLLSSKGRFYTGHQLFDELVELRYGTSILMTDETFSEAQTVLNILFENHGNESLKPIQIKSNPGRKGDDILDIGNLSIVETSINLNALRRKNPRQPFIHSSLPDIIIKNDPNKLLLTFENWQKNIIENQTIEFYLLPRNTFADLEKKILSLVDGAIQIHVSKDQGKFQSSLSPVRICKPEYHLKEYPYVIEGDRFLIYWEGEFTDRIVGIAKEEILRRIADHKTRLRELKVIEGPTTLKKSSPINDFWLYSQLKGVPLYQIRELFPESFDKIMERIVRWEATGIVKLAPVSKLEIAPITQGNKEPKFITKLALRLPSWLTYRLFRMQTGAVSKVPVDIYLTGRQSAVSLISILMQKAGIESPDDIVSSILEMERVYSNYESRKAAVEHIKALGESPTDLVLDNKMLPNLLKVALRTGYEVDASVKRTANEVFEFVVKDCYFCHDTKSETPICTAPAGGVEALCSLMFKKKSQVEEISCKAMGDRNCTYRLTLGE